MDITDVIEDGSEGIKLLSGGSAVNKIEKFSDEQRDKFLKSLAMLGRLRLYSYGYWCRGKQNSIRINSSL